MRFEKLSGILGSLEGSLEEILGRRPGKRAWRPDVWQALGGPGRPHGSGTASTMPH